MVYVRTEYVHAAYYLSMYFTVKKIKLCTNVRMNTLEYVCTYVHTVYVHTVRTV